MTEREKQIEEMAKNICEFASECKLHCKEERCLNAELCARVYDAGYRKEKQGKWVYKDEDLGCDIYMCSSCKEEYCLETGSPQDNFYNYCPSCGAKMDGGKAE